MPEHTVNVHAKRREVATLLRRLPEIAAGRRGGAAVFVRAMHVRLGLAALGHIREAFVVKARGGTGQRLEQVFAQCAEEALDRRRHLTLPRAGTPALSGARSPKPKARAKDRPSWMLTEIQRKRWWEVYRRKLAQYRGDKAHAAAVAWLVLKDEGATTLMATYGGASVEILRDTGLLLSSLTPGAPPAEAESSPPRRPHQAFRLGRGEVVVGTTRPWARTHHEGVPGKIPQRRLWPPVPRWPAAWWADILTQARDGLIQVALYLLGRRT